MINGNDGAPPRQNNPPVNGILNAVSNFVSDLLGGESDADVNQTSEGGEMGDGTGGASLVERIASQWKLMAAVFISAVVLLVTIIKLRKMRRREAALAEFGNSVRFGKLS
jgi:hypothetical protein